MNAETNACLPEVVCTLGDLVTGSGVAALYQGQQIALFYLPDEVGQQVFAVGNYDPIGRANVLSRGIVGDVKGETVVASPLYKQHFSLRSGQCIEDAAVSVPVYHVEVSGSDVLVHGVATS